MPLKTKIIVVSAIALVAAGGFYAFTPGGPQDAFDSHQAMNTPPVVAQPLGQTAPEMAGTNSMEVTKVPSGQATVAQQPMPSDKVANEAPKKLTRQQLTAPPATETEQLQKAAEQESNF